MPTIIYILLVLPLLYLTFSVLYIFICSVAGKKKRKEFDGKVNTYNKIAVLIPAYKEDAVILETARKATEQNYPANKFDVVVIADGLQSLTMESLSSLPVQLLEVFFEKSTKAKALNKAMKYIKGYDIAVVLDADNIMKPDFLERINESFAAGNIAVQGHRTAKNMETGYAFLDAVSEEINNHVFRKGHTALGLSSALIGSAMAFDFDLFKGYMQKIQAVGGFDKELEVRLLRDGVKIEYLENAIVYDEKVSQKEVFKNQRTRWLSAQIKYGIKYIGSATRELVRSGNIDFFDKVLQFWMLPRVLLLGSLLLTGLFSLVAPTFIFLYIVALNALYAMGLLLAIPSELLNRSLLKSLVVLPQSMLLMVRSLSGYKKAQTNFMHTPHQLKKS